MKLSLSDSSVKNSSGFYENGFIAEKERGILYVVSYQMNICSTWLLKAKGGGNP